MARIPKPWYRKDRKAWFVTIDGKRHNLGASKPEAFKRFHELMALDEVPTTITVAEVLDKFLVWTQQNRAPRTFEWYSMHLQGFLDSLANPLIDASAIKPHHIESWVQGDWSASTRRGAMGSVQRAFKWAHKQGLVKDLPLASLEKPSNERRDNCPTDGEVKALIKTATEPFKSLLLFLIETGCRPQEAIAIEPEYVQGDKVVFPVKESKGKKYARVIYLTEKAKNALGVGFRNTRGGKWTAYSINCRMRRLAEKTGKHIAAYDLRHYTLTRWLESGLDHITVARLAGHRSSAMLSRHYSHICGDFLLEQLRKVQ